MKKLIKIIISLLILVIAGLLLYNIINSSRTVYNSEDTAGNTSGNLFNGGLFLELNQKIYFSNLNDNGSLYSMDLALDNYKKINKDRAAYINGAGKYLYYTRMNYKNKKTTKSVFSFSNTGIYRINLNGGNTISLYENPGGLINLYGNTLYYQHYNSKEGLKLYQVGIDGNDEKKISDEPILPMTIWENSLYYTGTDKDHYIYARNLTTGNRSLVYDGNCYAPIINNNTIYFMSQADDYTIYRIEKDQETPVQIINQRCSTYNITEDGQYLYYQIDNNESNGIGSLNLTTGERTVIKEGNYKNINIAGGYVFFEDFEEHNIYYLPVGSANSVSVFNPPVDDK